MLIALPKTYLTLELRGGAWRKRTYRVISLNNIHPPLWIKSRDTPKDLIAQFFIEQDSKAELKKRMLKRARALKDNLIM